jgi:hypothetical protein
MSLVYTEITLKNADDILLGGIPMEAMDLTVNPRKEEVVGAHGDDEIHKKKSAFGCLSQFADPSKISGEKNAWAQAVLEKNAIN